MKPLLYLCYRSKSSNSNLVVGYPLTEPQATSHQLGPAKCIHYVHRLGNVVYVFMSAISSRGVVNFVELTFHSK
jgi:hypothetical protein